MSDSQPPQDSDLAAGTKVGFYEVAGRTDAAGRVITRVGSGGFGTLYRVRRENTDYALKMSKLKMSELGAADRKHSEDRFRREVSILLALSHPNIVRVHAFDYWPTRDGHPFLIMDFVEGERLYEWQRKLAPSLRSICEVFIKTALALHELHRHGIFHRDIKSDNLVVRPDGEPVLLDMGIARSGSNFTVTADRSVLGTFAHFSPEQCRCYLSEEFQRGEKRFEQTAQSELHSLGYMLYEVLTGRAPFPPAEDEFALMRSIAHAVPIPPSMVNSRVPGALDSVVMRLLEKDPLQRPESGQAFAADLDRVVADASDTSWNAPFDVPVPLAHDAPTPPSRRHAPRPVSAERGAPKIAVSAERPVADPAVAKAVSIEKMQPPKLDGRFSPPTVDKSPFQSPVPSAPAQVNAPTAADQAHTLQGEMAKVAAKLGTASRSAQRSRATQVALALGVLVVIGGVLALVSQGAKTQKPRNLLAEVQKNEKAAALDGGASAVASPAAPPANATAALVPPPPAVADKPPAMVEKRGAAANRDAREIDAEIAREYGRPTLPDTRSKPGAAAQLPAEKARPEQPAWLQVAIPDEPAPATRTAASTSAPGAMAAPPRYGVPTGAHIRARLQTNLDSRTVANGPVEAMLMRPFLANGKAVFASRTMLYGTAQTSGNRFTIRFTRVRLPDDTEIPFEGLAYDMTERKPGLAGRLVGAPAVQPGNNTAAKVASAVAGTALGAVGGDLAQNAAREAGQVVMRDATSPDAQISSGQALLLDAGQDFEVFVSKPF